jgi:hypothetical protein
MKDTILSIARHALTFGGGLIAANNGISEGASANIVGAIVALIGLIWGARDEYLAAQKPK